MKAPAYSAAPLSGEPEKKKLSFRELLLGQKKNERCFSAEDPGHSVCLLWMESSHFGSRYAYPVLVWEESRTALRYDSAPTAEAGENNRRLMERWAVCTAPERLAALEIRPMELQDFRAKLRALQNGEQAE